VVLLQSLLDHASDLVQGMTLDGKLSYVNAAWQQALGYGDREWKGLDGLAVVAERWRSPLRGLLQQVCDTRTTREFQGSLLSRHGQEIPVHGQIACDPNAAPVPDTLWILWRPLVDRSRTFSSPTVPPMDQIFGSFVGNEGARWLTQIEGDRPLSEWVIKQQQEQLRLILITGKMGTWEWDLPSGQQLWSETLEALFGLAPGEFDGQLETFYGRIYSEDLQRIHALHQRMRTTGGDFQEVYRIVLPDGSLRWLRTQGQVYTDAHGAPISSLGVSMDITEYKGAEAKILEALAQERDLGALKSRFVSMVSHEVRTPLTTIMSSVDVLQNIPCEETERQELFALIQSSIRRMVQLLEDALSIGLRDAGTSTLQPTQVDLVAFCQHLIQDLQSSLGWEHRLELDWHAQESWVCLDSKLLRQILNNLLGNAIKYSAPGSTVTLRVNHRDDRLQFQVQDQGIGIPQEEQQHLFNDFYRAGNVGAVTGTGLGLAIVKNSVERYGGAITVASNLGVGTTFTVTLPLPQANSALSEASNLPS
jgi:PAS domain S-box-containing protein